MTMTSVITLVISSELFCSITVVTYIC